jgi:hypothetical protein
MCEAAREKQMKSARARAVPSAGYDVSSPESQLGDVGKLGTQPHSPSSRRTTPPGVEPTRTLRARAGAGPLHLSNLPAQGRASLPLHTFFFAVGPGVAERAGHGPCGNGHRARVKQMLARVTPHARSSSAASAAPGSAALSQRH